MHPTLQLLERHEEAITSHNTHWFDLPEQSFLVQSDHQQFNLLASHTNSASLTTDVWPTSSLNILFYPKAKERLSWWLYQLSQNFTASQTLWVVGENNGGIKSLPKRVKAYFDCTKIDSARHCSLFELTRSTEQLPAPEWTSFTHDGQQFFALPGVFSAGRLDKGTDVLLSVLPMLSGNVLEFGGGCGIITARVASLSSVSHVTALEIDLLATQSSKKTLVENNLSEKAHTLWSNGTQALEPQLFDAIISNPPFHQGIKTAYAPTESFFQQAYQWVKPGGTFVWVANDFLNYQSLLEPHFLPAQQLAHDKGFRVFSATRMRRT